MRIPLNWLKEFVKLPESQKELTERLTMAGHMLDKTDRVNGEEVIDLELRGNRADCYSIVGIAREVSALFKTKVHYPKATLKLKTVPQLKEVKLSVQTPLVKRVMMARITNVKITKSPPWLVQKLLAYGIAPINNIVDLSNYVMVETGEPMHAFDLDRVGKNLAIRLAKKGEKMTTFIGETITLNKDDLVWANETSVLSIAGSIGGKTHSITESTKNVLLEAANYDRANIRRSIHRHKLLTEAGIRHEKELDPNMVEGAMVRFLELTEKNGWGKVQRTISDFYAKAVTPWRISLTYRYLNSLAGLVIEPAEVKQILTSLGFGVARSDARGLEVEVPTYRTDVRLPEDLIEEVLRIYGYGRIPVKTLSLQIPTEITPPEITQEERARQTMTALGFDEVISMPFVEEKLLSLNKGLTPVRVSNRPSPDIEELRTTLLPNLRSMAQKILNERGEEVRLFEIGKIYYKVGGQNFEKRALGMIYRQEGESGFAYFKGFLEAFFRQLGLPRPEYNLLGGRRYEIRAGKSVIGFGDEEENLFYAEIDLEAVLGKEREIGVELWPKYPPQVEDITLILPPKTRVGEVEAATGGVLTTIYKDAYTFRLWFYDPQKTLTDEEVAVKRTKLLSELKQKFGVRVKE